MEYWSSGMKKVELPHSTMKMFSVVLLVILVGMGGFFPLSVWGQDERPEIRQVTTHPSMDFSPSVSPDGRWLAFVSERSGNLDVWIKALPRGRVVQVTTHQSEDIHPVWSPDGKRLAFISKRRDAQGDIWLVPVDLTRGGSPKEEPVQITDYLGRDRDHTFSPDGKRIVFASDRDGMMNLFSIELTSERTTQLTVSGGMDPAHAPVGDWILFTSFRIHPEGDLFLIDTKRPEVIGGSGRVAYPVTWGETLDGQGAWSPDGTEIVFLRFDRDSNEDGKVTPEDNGSLWQKKLVAGGEVSPERISIGRNEIQITTEIYRDAEPCWTREGDILFTSFRGGGMDVWMIPCGGLFIRAIDANDQYATVMAYSADAVTREAWFQSVLGYRRVQDYFPSDSLWVSRSLIQIGEIFLNLRESVRAEDVLEIVRKDFTGQKREAALAELKLAIFTEKSVDIRIEQCRRIIESFPGEPSVVAETYIILGDLYLEVNEKENSLSAYGKVIQSFPGLPNFRAQAQIKIGDMLQEEGQRETAKQSYLTVLREFGAVPLWRQRASERLLGQIQGSPQERIRGLQQIINKAPNLHSLVAEAQLAIGRTLMELGQYDQAIRELELIELMVPDLRWAHAEANILRARVYGELGSELQGILLMERIVEDFGNVEGGRFVSTAEEALFNLLFDSAERLKSLEDYTLAESRYRKALQLRPDDVRVHRGLIEVVYRGGGIEELIQDYETRLQDRPRDPVLLYGLGLALSYYGENRPEVLQRSNIYLIQALEEDYRLIYPYRTLGYNYELLEGLEEKKAREKSSLFKRVGRTVSAPFRWLVGLLPFGGEETKEGYYEKAIQALITAIELNDESQDPRMEALLAQNLANNFYHLGEFSFKNAYRYYRMRLSLDTTFTQLLEKARIYERTGHCGVITEDMENSDDYLLTAIQVYKDLGMEQDARRNLKMLALFYQLGEKYEEAISVYEKTLIDDERARRWEDVERSYRNIAFNYHLMGEPEDALMYARKAERLLLRSEIPMKPPEKNSLRVEILGLSIPVWSMEEISGASAEGFTLADEAAFIYGLIGRSMESMKSYPEAIAYEMKRLEIFRKRKDRLAERISLNRLGSLYFKMADYDKAWEYFKLSWEEVKKKKDDRGRWVNSINLGNVAAVELTLLKEQRYTEPAIKCLEEELEKIRSDESEPFLRQEMVLVNMLGTLWILRAKSGSEVEGTIEIKFRSTLDRIDALREAESYFREGIRLAREGGFWKEEGILLKNLAEVAEYLHDYQTALALLQQSHQIFQENGEEELLWRVMCGMAKIRSHIIPDSSFSVDENITSLSCFQQAMDQLESLPVQSEGSEERLSDREERWSLYVDAAYEMSRQGMLRKSLETVERGRKKQITDLLARRPPLLKRERHKIAWGNLRYLQSRLKEIRQNLLEGGVGLEARRRLKELRKEQEEKEREYREVLENTKNEGAVLAYLSGVEPVDLEQVQSVLPEGGGALYYVVGDQHTSLWSVDKDTLFWTEIGIGRDQLQMKVTEFLRRIEKDSMVQEMSRDLYDILVKPADSFIEEKTEMIIVPDGFLWDIPFGALTDGENILLEKTAIVYAPSLTAYRLAWERKKINQDDGLLMGDVLDKPFHAPMAKAVKLQQTLLGSQATESAFQELVESKDLIQVERWMVANERIRYSRPWFSHQMKKRMVLFK